MNTVGEDCEEPIHDLVPFLGIDLLGEVHRSLHVSEENGNLLALAFERAARSEYFVGQVLRGVRARIR